MLLLIVTTVKRPLLDEHTLLHKGSCYELKQLHHTQMNKRMTLRRQLICPCEIRRLGSCYSGSIFPYLDLPAFPCKFSLLLVLHFICILLCSVCTSEMWFKYFSAKLVNKCSLPCALMHLCQFFSHSYKITLKI